MNFKRSGCSQFSEAVVTSTVKESLRSTERGSVQVLGDICSHLNVSISTLTYYSRPYPGRESAVDRRLDLNTNPSARFLKHF